MDQIPMKLDVQDLLNLLTSKEVDIALRNKQIEALTRMVNELQAKLAAQTEAPKTEE